MAILNRTESGAASTGAIVLDLGDLRAHAEEIVGAARREAAALLEEAQRERRRLIAGAAEDGARRGVEEGLRVGREAGLERGRREAIERASAEIGALAGAWREALGGFAAQRDEALRIARDDLLRLALAVAERIARRAIELDPSAVQRALEESVGRCAEATKLSVAVHPGDRRLAEAVLPELCAALGDGAHATLVEDDAVGPGGCRVRTIHAEVDASISGQLDRFAEAVGVVGARA